MIKDERGVISIICPYYYLLSHVNKGVFLLSFNQVSLLMACSYNKVCGVGFSAAGAAQCCANCLLAFNRVFNHYI